MLLVLGEKFGAERRSGDVHEVLAEFGVVGAVVPRRRRQRLARNVCRLNEEIADERIIRCVGVKKRVAITGSP